MALPIIIMILYDIFSILVYVRIIHICGSLHDSYELGVFHFFGYSYARYNKVTLSSSPKYLRQVEIIKINYFNYSLKCVPDNYPR